MNNPLPIIAIFNRTQSHDLLALNDKVQAWLKSNPGAGEAADEEFSEVFLVPSLMIN